MVADPTLKREPGPRSIATTERILASAETLICKHGDKFTIGEVASLGRVSIASIYARFCSKDELIRELQTRILDDLIASIRGRLLQLSREGGDLEWRTARLVDAYAEAHLARAATIRALRDVSRYNPALHLKGLATVDVLVSEGAMALASFNHRHPEGDVPARIAVTVRVFMHALAAYLGFRSASGGDPDEEWIEFKQAVSRMVFLSVSELITER